MHQHTAKSTSSFQEEMAHLPAATTATSTSTTPEHTDYGRRLVAHAVELWLGESSYSVQIMCPDASRSLNFLIRRTRECCASKSVREKEAKDARGDHAGLCDMAVFPWNGQVCRLSCCLCTHTAYGMSCMPEDSDMRK